ASGITTVERASGFVMSEDTKDKIVLVNGNLAQLTAEQNFLLRASMPVATAASGGPTEIGIYQGPNSPVAPLESELLGLQVLHTFPAPTQNLEPISYFQVDPRKTIFKDINTMAVTALIDDVTLTFMTDQPLQHIVDAHK